MSNADPRGKFVWHELLTADAAAATAFYTKVVAWKTQPWEQDASYSLWVAKNGPVGGIASPDGAAVPHWLPYIAVADVAATAETAKSLGGRVLKEKTDIPNGGSYAVLADPQGAEFAVYKSGAPSPGSPAPGAGDFTWHELATSDAKAALDFYSKLVGWEVGPVHDMGAPAGLYHLFLHEGNQYGGIFVSNTGGGPSWLCYIGVEDAGKAVAAAKSAGGRVLNGPTEVPGGSWVAQVLDPEGAPFAVHEPAKAAASEAAKAKPAASISKPPQAKKPKPDASISKPPQAAAAQPDASISKPPQAKPDASISKPPQAAKPKLSASISKPPQVAKPKLSASVEKPPQASKPKPAASISKPPQAAKPKLGASISKPPQRAAKSAAKKGKKAPAKKAAAKKAPAKKKVAKKSAARGKAAAKKGKKKSAAKRAPAKKKASRAKAKKHR
ncbi:MAG: VOC family protein [Gammaproteobacteria bacterium]